MDDGPSWPRGRGRGRRRERQRRGCAAAASLSASVCWEETPVMGRGRGGEGGERELDGLIACYRSSTDDVNNLIHVYCIYWKLHEMK